jgi:hypothetical protein
MNILDCPMGQNDAEAATVRDYLKALLRELWASGEGFSGKRPFGNSGWEYEVYTALVKADLVEGKLDTDGYIEKVDRDTADRLILAAIDTL